MDLMTVLVFFYIFCWIVLLCLPELIILGIIGTIKLCSWLDKRVVTRRDKRNPKKNNNTEQTLLFFVNG